MEIILKQIKQILVTAMLMLFIVPVIAQVKSPATFFIKHPAKSSQHIEFYRLVAQANITFTYPKGFREIKAPDDEDFSFDYALELPAKDFEIWFKIKPEKENWASYEKSLKSPDPQMANPDSLYNDVAEAHATAFTGDKKYFVRTIPPNILARYNADAGKSYLLTLLDLPDTKHYKYALLITLQKNHTGTIMAICFTNEKGPEFFKNIDRASNCLRFKTPGQ
jgi:hypothetical protein